MIQFYEAEKERYQKRAKEVKKEAKEMLTSGEIQQQIERERDREIKRIQAFYQDKLARNQS
jgi:hypothetical protein